MKRHVIIVSFLLAGFTAGMIGCKKGENDPFISLKTRKGRLVGEWKLEEGENTKVSSVTGLGATTTVTKYNGSNKTVTVNGVSSPPTTYSESITIEKDGTFEIETIEDDDGDGKTETETNEGLWQFVGKNKEGELKNKEAVVFTITKSISGGVTYSYEGLNAFSMVWVLDKLSSKELVVKADAESTGPTSTSTTTGSVTYEKK